MHSVFRVNPAIMASRGDIRKEWCIHVDSGKVGEGREERRRVVTMNLAWTKKREVC